MQQSSATPSLHLWFWGVAEDCCMLSILLAVPSCIYSFWHGVIPTSYFIFNDFYTCICYVHVHTGLTRSRMVCLAYLLGSDYTAGLQGVGVVNAMEVIGHFGGEGTEPLRKLK